MTFSYSSFNKHFLPFYYLLRPCSRHWDRAVAKQEEKGKERRHVCICIYYQYTLSTVKEFLREALSDTNQNWIFSNLLFNNLIYIYF